MSAHQVDRVIRGFSAQLQGKQRGPDHDPEGRRRVPRRDSYDVEDPRAKPWRRIGDGSPGQGLAYRDALVQAAEELYQQLWRKYPLPEVREARSRHAAISAELDRYAAGEPAPVGRPAILRRELEQLTGYLKEADNRLRRVDVTVLKALLHPLDFATGRLYQAIGTIASRAGCHRNSAIAALRRLREHGFIAWVRRTIRTGNDHEFAPQREQTSNAYYFDHRRKMAGRVFQRYWQLVVARLRKLGAIPQGVAEPPPREVRDPELRALLARAEAAVLAESAST